MHTTTAKLPAAANSTASLIKATKNNELEKDDMIMSNISRGGEERFKTDRDLFYLKPLLVFDINPDELS